MQKKPALTVGSFIRQENGDFKGTLQTLAFTAEVTFRKLDEKEKDSHPDYNVTHNETGNNIGVAWDYVDDRGHYVSYSPEEPSLAPGSYKLVKSGVEKGYTLNFRKLSGKKDAKK